MKNLQVSVETITPALAKEYLNSNTTNRPCSDLYVRAYADAMLRGEWKLNGSSIDFDTDGRLINGQHRLKACIMANKPFDSVVVRGVVPEAYTTYDNGRSRNAGQLLQMQGIPNAGLVSACVKQAFMIQNGLVCTKGGHNGSAGRGLTNSQVVELFNGDPETYIDCTKAAIRIKGGHVLRVGQMAGYMYYLRSRLSYSKGMVEVFFSDICSYSTVDNPMLDALRQRFLRDATLPIKMTNEYKHNLIRKAWNAWIDGKVIKRITWDKDNEGTVKLH